MVVFMLLLLFVPYTCLQEYLWASVTICYLSLLCNYYKECVLEFVATLRHINADLIKEAFDPDSSEAALCHESTGPLSRLNPINKHSILVNVDLKLCV